MIGIIIVAVLGPLLTSLFLIKPKIGLLMYIATFPFTNLPLVPGMGIDKAVGSMALTSWFIYSFCVGKLKVRPSKQFIALLLFVGLAVLSIWFISISPHKVNLTLFYISLPVLYLMIINLVDSEGFLGQLILVLVSSMGVYIFLSMTGYLIGTEAVVKKGRLGGIVSPAPNIFGYYVIGILPLSLLIARSKNFATKWLGRSVFIAGMTGVILTFSRGAFLGLIFLVFLWIIVFRANRMRIVSLSAVMVLLLLFMLPSYVDRISTIRVEGILSNPRWFFTVAASKMFIDHPFFGVGVDSFRYNFPQYASVELIKERNPWLYSNIDSFYYPHGLLTAILSETGLLGSLLFLFIVIESLVILRQTFKSNSDYCHAMAKYLTIALLGYLFTGVFYGHGRTSFLWLYLFLPAALDQIRIFSKRKLPNCT
jgi:O-antigen ligase